MAISYKSYQTQIKIIRKIEVIIDPDTDVPECYSIYFQKKSRQKPIESSFLFKIVVEKKRGRKMSTTVSWDPKKTNLTKDQIENLKNLQKELGTNATLEKNSMVYFYLFHFQCFQEYDLFHFLLDELLYSFHLQL